MLSPHLLVILGILFLLFLIICWFLIPYSPVKNEYNKDKSMLMNTGSIGLNPETFKKEDFGNLPFAIQNFIMNSGYIGAPKMSFLEIKCRNVSFKQGKTGPALTIDYTECNFVKHPARLALIKSSLFGIPFEGYDYYKDGTGGMKGVIAKLVTLFHQTGRVMDKACLATFLAESLFAPSLLLQDYISFEEIGPYEVKASMFYAGQSASGTFYFNDTYEMTSFTTTDRGITGTDGTIEYLPWSAVFMNYKVLPCGIRFPSVIQIIWHYPDGDFTYFDGKICDVLFGIL